MITFKSVSDLSKLPHDNPAYFIIEDLSEKLLTTAETMDRPYDPDADGYLVLIDEKDIVRPLTEIWGDDAYRLSDIPWEGISRHQDNFYIGIFLANNEFGLVFVIPDADWLPDELRNVLEDNLIPTPENSTTQP